METLAKRLTLQALKCFTDLQILLHWIKGIDTDWKHFFETEYDRVED